MSSIWVFRLPQKATAPASFAQGRLAVGASNQEARNVLKEATDARKAAIDALSTGSTLEQALAAVNTYVGNLLALQSAGQAGAAQPGPALGRMQTAVTFKWADSVAGAINAFTSVDEELANVLLAFAVWCTRRSAALPFSSNGDDPATKEAYHCLRRASGLFDYVVELRRRAVSHHPGTDFDERVLKSLSAQALAEAQEITLERARQKGNAPDLIAQIAADTQAKFEAAEASVKDIPAMLAVYRTYLAFKKSFYKAFSQHYQGMYLFAQDKCGDAIKVFTLARESLDNAAKDSQGFATAMRCRPLTQHTVYTNLDAALKKALEKANHENGFIYHQRVPADAPAPAEPKAIVQVEPYVLPAPAVSWSAAKFEVEKVPLRGQNTAADLASTDNAPVAKTEVPAAAGLRPQEEQLCVVS